LSRFEKEGMEMRPTDVDRIASAVAGTLAGTKPGLLGCGSLSSNAVFEVENLDCEISYYCGGAAAFVCLFEFDCGSGVGPFYCGAGAPGSDLFQCSRAYACDPNGAFLANGTF
jgi:hypothetical protein